MLLLLVLVPLGGAALTVAVGRSPGASRAIALGAALGSVVLAGLAWAGHLADPSQLVFTAGERVPASAIVLVADGLSVPLVALTCVLGTVALLASFGSEREAPQLALLLALQAAVTTVFLAGDLILFYVAWEAVLIPMYFLIGGWGHENRRYAAMKFFVYTFAGSAPMLVGIVLLALGHGSTALSWTGEALDPARQASVFWLLSLGFLVKVPVWPLHTWLPDAHVEAPTGGSIMLAGVLLKMGGYGLVRLCAGQTPAAFARFAPVLAVLGGVGIVYGAVMALAQHDLKRLIAYSSVAHMGFVVLALSSGSELGLGAAMLGMVSHGLVAGLLFFLAGALYERAHTRELAALGGLGTRLPAFSAAFVFASLAGVGLPGLSGFPGEFGAVLASFARYGWPVAGVGVGIALAGAYGLRAVRLVVHGEPTPHNWSDLGTREIAVVVLLGVLVVALGVWPRFVTDVASSATSAVGALLGSVTP